MLDQVLGRPSPTVRRTQIFLVLFFWIWRLYKGDGSGMGVGRPRRVTRRTPRDATYTRTWWRRVWAFLVARRSGPRWMTNINLRLSESSLSSSRGCDVQGRLALTQKNHLHPISLSLVP